MKATCEQCGKRCKNKAGVARHVYWAHGPGAGARRRPAARPAVGTAPDPKRGDEFTAKLAKLDETIKRWDRRLATAFTKRGKAQAAKRRLLVARAVAQASAAAEVTEQPTRSFDFDGGNGGGL